MQGYLTEKENKGAIDHKRFAFLELMLIWEGCVQAQHIEQQFEISRSLADLVIKKYRELYPNNTQYDGQQGGYRATDDMVAQHTDGTLHDYVQTIADHAMISDLPLPSRRIEPVFVRPILQAIRERRRLSIEYASVNNPNFKQRIIQPHQLVFDGLRWHVRAYCENNMAFRDFVLSRIRSDSPCELLDDADHSDLEDQDWHAFIDLEIQPDSRLEDVKQTLIALDYDMSKTTQGFKKVIPVRKAMLMYLMRRLGLDQYHTHPEIQQITLTPQSQSLLRDY